VSREFRKDDTDPPNAVLNVVTTVGLKIDTRAYRSCPRRFGVATAPTECGRVPTRQKMAEATARRGQQRGPARAGPDRAAAPPRAVSQRCARLSTNATDASPPPSAVMIAVRIEAARIELAIRRRGAGMPGEILRGFGRRSSQPSSRPGMGSG